MTCRGANIQHKVDLSFLARIALALLVAGCGQPAVSTPGASTPPLPTLGAAELEAATRFRESVGLRADASWIQAVAADPASDRTTFGVPLTLDESAELDRRSRSMDEIEAVVGRYAPEQESWAGSFIDHARGGIYVVQFKGPLEAHLRALLGSLHPLAPLEVRSVRWSLDDLESLKYTVAAEEDWFATLPAVLTGVGPDVMLNRLAIQISSANPQAEELVLEHFGWDREIAVVESDGTGALLLPRGRLVVRAVDGDGNPVMGLACVAESDVAGAHESRPLAMPMTDAQGECSLDLPATGYDIALERGAAPPEVVATGRAVVHAGKTSTIVITVEPGRLHSGPRGSRMSTEP